MIRLIIMDVDGVIVGHKKGVNFPYPSKKVISALKKVRQSGIPVVLCSGKFYQALKPVIQKAQLNNLHITDSGSVVFDPVTERIRSFSIERNLASNIISIAILNNIYIEMYSEDDYFIQQGNRDEMLPRRVLILKKEPKIVKSLVKEAAKYKVIKLITVDKNMQERKKTEKILSQFEEKVNIIWTMHPSTKPWEYCLLTSTEASKTSAAKAVAKQLGITLEDTLGVGDTLGDWEFMKLCGYAATMEDGSTKLKGLVESKGEGKYLVAPSVNEDGILNIFDYFLNN